MRVILDAGLLIAQESRPDAAVGLVDSYAELTAAPPHVPATVVAQVWRGGARRQAPLARLLAGVDIDVLDEPRAREVGQLLANSGTSDIADAHVVIAAESGDLIITSDPIDIARLAKVAGKQVAIIAI